MITSTSSTHHHVYTVLLYAPSPRRRPTPALAPESIAWARGLVANPDYPTAAVIRYLTRQVIAAISFPSPPGEPGPPAH